MPQFNIVNVDSTQNTYTLFSDGGLIATGASQVLFQLDVSAFVGQTTRLMGQDNLWELHQWPGQTIRIGNAQTTLGTAGSIKANAISDSIDVICTVSGTEFVAYVLSGSPTIT